MVGCGSLSLIKELNHWLTSVEYFLFRKNHSLFQNGKGKGEAVRCSRASQALNRRVGGSEVEGSAVIPRSARSQGHTPMILEPQEGKWVSARSTSSVARLAGRPLQDTKPLGCVGCLARNPRQHETLSTWRSEVRRFPAPQPADPLEPSRP